MLKLSFTITLVVLSVFGFAQSPHGEGFKTGCAECHTSKDWKVDQKTMTFDHNTTTFKLTGQHQFTDCKSCHQTLKFQEAKTECISCHTDMHQNTLGPDCARCHTTKSWIIENTLEMHQMSRFPLLGNHAVLDCASCHKSASNFRFEPLGIDCYDCHKADYLATTSPNHQESSFPTNCLQCHDVKAISWNTGTFNHDFFPLTGGHAITCAQCHTGGTFTKISSECVSCHQSTYNAAQTPNHTNAGIAVDCKTCHNITTWKPSSFNHTTTGFALTGSHSNIVQCSACHQGNTSNASPECNSCHQTNYASAETPSHSKAGIPVD